MAAGGVSRCNALNVQSSLVIRVPSQKIFAAIIKNFCGYYTLVMSRQYTHRWRDSNE